MGRPSMRGPPIGSRSRLSATGLTASNCYTLGGRKKRVLTQAESYDPSHPIDHKFVENVMWEESQVLFVTLNMPGSNNDGLPWSGGGNKFKDEVAQVQEVTERTGADIRWL